MEEGKEKGEKERGRRKGQEKGERKKGEQRRRKGTEKGKGEREGDRRKGKGKGKGEGEREEKKSSATDWVNVAGLGNFGLKNPCIDGATLKHIGNTFWHRWRGPQK